MGSSPRLSMIVATCGRKEEVAALLESFARQTCDRSVFEVIVVDQNNAPLLDEIIARYSSQFSLLHIRNEVKGLSLNRNRGMDKARGEIVCFPDDDCVFYPDTIQHILSAFDSHQECAMILGRVYDRETRKDALRKWPKEEQRVTVRNFFFLYTAITIFHRANEQRFDEKMGVGTYFGSYEDADFVLRALRHRGIVWYTPTIDVWHPPANIFTMAPAKISSYGLGFGALVRKHGGIVLWALFLAALSYHGLFALGAILKFDKEMLRRRWAAFWSRVRGAWEYAP